MCARYLHFKTYLLWMFLVSKPLVLGYAHFKKYQNHHKSRVSMPSKSHNWKPPPSGTLFMVLWWMKLPSIAPNHSWHLVDAFSKNFCSNPNQWWIAAIFHADLHTSKHIGQFVILLYQPCCWAFFSYPGPQRIPEAGWQLDRHDLQVKLGPGAAWRQRAESSGPSPKR